MSSHHIIRDRQEPALLIFSIEDIPFELLGNLLEWSPTVICTEDSVMDVLNNGIKVDAITITGENAETVEQAHEIQVPLEEITCAVGLEIDAAMEWLIQKEYTAVNLMMDEKTMYNLFDKILSFGSKMDLVIYDGMSRHLVLNKPVFQKWVTAGKQFKIDAVGRSILLHTKGFSDNVNKQVTTPVTLTAHETGLISIETSHLPLLVTEKISINNQSRD